MVDKDIEKIREEKLEDLREKHSEEEQEEIERKKEEMEKKKNAILKQNLTDDARRRLNNVKMAKPDFGEQVEEQLLALIQSGRVQDKIDEDIMKQILEELNDDTSFDIKGGVGSR